MLVKVRERVGKNLEFKNNKYKILKKTREILLREILVEKRKLKYAFIGGMWYSRKNFSLKTNSSIHYPFSTYYIQKILDKKYKGKLCRSLQFVKIPIAVLQFERECLFIEFQPVLKLGGKEMFPFISLSEEKNYYNISFFLFDEFYIKEKEHAWLGFGKKKKVKIDFEQGEEFEFSLKIKLLKDWREGVKSFFRKELPKEVKFNKAPKEVFNRGVKCLYRSYDDLNGTFIQLPWKETTGFVFVDFSYSLLAFEARRLYYFTKWYFETKEGEFLNWSLKLRNLFLNKKLYKENLKYGKGLVWYNMSELTKKGLKGLFYLDCGYGGYPGGQGTIAFNLLKYLELKEDKEIENLVKKSLDYILSTQKKNGSWPMALPQGGLRFRLEKMEKEESHGGTAECVRALLQGYKLFKKEEFRKAALRGLKYLESSYPICYNGLRDIGIREAEAFSAISVVEAFLDAYEITKNKKYLEQALNYSYYILTFIYLFDTKKLNLKFNFHPISESITPRLSPYESCLIVSTFIRLYNKTKQSLFKKIAKLVYSKVLEEITENWGLSEGVFPKFFDKFYSLPMEQTFATTELLNASSNFFKMKVEKKKERKVSKEFEFRKVGKILVIYYKSKEIFRFDAEKFKVIFINGEKLNLFSLSFYNPYSTKGKLKMKIKNFLRGSKLKYLLLLGMVKYVFRGVYPPSPLRKNKICLFENQKKMERGVRIKGNKAYVYSKTNLHKVESEIFAERVGGKIKIIFKPFIIRVLSHDLDCKKVLFPIVGKKLKRKEENTLHFNNFSLKCNFGKIIETSSFCGFDQTLETNWTHGGIFKGSFEIILNL